MTMQRLMRKALWTWQDWRFDCRMKRERPEWHRARKQAEKQRKRHGKVKPYDARTSAQCIEELKRDVMQ